RRQRRTRPALVAARRPAAPVGRAAASEAEGFLANVEVKASNAPAVADSSQPAAATVAAAPAPGAARKAAEMVDSGRAKLMAMSRMAPAAPADSATARVFREEASKRKAELPPAPALAPFPVGGYPALRSYLRREQRRPETGIGGQAHSDGIVKLKFMVDADGAVHDIQVVRGVNPEYDEEAIRLVCEGPAWRPAIVNGRRTAQAVRLDVPFH
ncbi:energy transducer TonB, partial [Hymenobacter sp. 15J16-1T3B]|uniref:energy transducer TonB n=1 Tax=Hymenobacter sp. 15J16-1T3B TaxID=2886941 RepID=UPI001D11D895